MGVCFYITDGKVRGKKKSKSKKKAEQNEEDLEVKYK